MSALQTLAKPRRIKASHRRRWKSASGQSVQRYYDPAIGRFLSVDPVTANSANGSNFNRYKYANNNPYKFTDPDGRADINYFNEEDTLYSSAEKFDLPGFTTVMGHADGYTYQDQRDSGAHVWGPSISDKTLSRDIAAVKSPGDYILLVGCYMGGAGRAPQNLAKQFDTKVIAGTAYTRRSRGSDGSITYTVNSKMDGKGKAGYFTITTPDGKTSGRIASITMTKDGHPVFKPFVEEEKPKKEEVK